MDKVTLITPTKNRPQCFALLEQYIANQTVKPDQWIVVNSGEAYQYTQGQEVVQRPYEDMIDICENYLAAIPLAKGDIVLCVEDDDVYMPTFISEMRDALQYFDLVGLSPAYYYNRRYQQWNVISDANDWTSLACTGFTRKVLPPFEEICKRGNSMIDMALWDEWKETSKWYEKWKELGQGKPLIANARDTYGLPLHVGMKGLWGEPGIGSGHGSNIGRFDEDLHMLKAWLGDYWLNYR